MCGSVFGCARVFLAVWVCVCVFGYVGLRVVFWLYGCAGVFLAVWVCGCAGVFVVAWFWGSFVFISMKFVIFAHLR